MARLNASIALCCRCFVLFPVNITRTGLSTFLRCCTHTATGYTPQLVLFGWNPRDLRAPLLSAETVDPDVSSGDPDVDVWLRSRADALRRAQVSLEHAREAMIRAHKASDKPHVYAAGDVVKISTTASRSYTETQIVA